MLSLTQRRQVYRTQLILLHQDFALLRSSILGEVALVADGLARYVVRERQAAIDRRRMMPHHRASAQKSQGGAGASDGQPDNKETTELNDLIR